MFGFAFKKWFFDLWDHLFYAFIINVAFVAVMAVPLLLPGLFLGGFSYATSPVFGLILLCITLLLASLFGTVAARFAWDMARSERIDFRQFLPYLKESLLPGLALAATNIVFMLVATTALPFYAAQDGFLSTVGLALVAWMLLFWLVISQFYLPLNAQFEKRVVKLYKKSSLLFMDNPGLSIAMLLVSLLILVLSVLTLSLFPGITGMLLWHQVCLKLRMYKYDWLEENPEAKRNKVPWDALLEKEREKLGVRTLRNMIFPWKD